MRNSRKQTYVFIIALLPLYAFSQSKMKITNVSCLNTYEIWINEKEFEKLNHKNDTIFVLNKKEKRFINEILKLQIADTSYTNEIERVKADLLSHRSDSIYANKKEERQFIYEALVTNRIDVRVKVELYKKNNIYKTIYLDSHGDYKIANVYYKRNESLEEFIKKKGKKIGCWGQVNYDTYHRGF